MADMMGTFVPTYQGLSATDFIRAAATTERGFPFEGPHCLPFYRATGAIYQLCRALRTANPRLTVLAPDYNSGNEILAMRAAGVAIGYYPVRRNMQLDPDEVEQSCRVHRPDMLYV